MKKETITIIILGVIYLFLAFMTNLLSTYSPFTISSHIIINLAIASLLSFVIFKKDDKIIKKGFVVSFSIFIILLIAQIILSYAVKQPTGGFSPISSLYSAIQNPVTFFITFLTSFNIPFIIKGLISKPAQQGER